MASSDLQTAIDIRPLESIIDEDFWRIMPGYTATQRYEVRREMTPQATTFSVTLVDLATPYVREWARDEWLGIETYNQYIGHGLSVGAFDGEKLVGFAITEPRDWNHSLLVWEFSVDPAYLRQGIGRRLMDDLEQVARGAGLRAIVCETQNTNANAVQFYFAAGFELDGIDLSFYTNHDQTEGEIAFFMKRKFD